MIRRRFAPGNGRFRRDLRRIRQVADARLSDFVRAEPPLRACPQHLPRHARTAVAASTWRTTTPTDQAVVQARACASPTAPGGKAAARRTRPRLNKYRLALVLAGLGVLAAVSTVFGMMMAVAQDLPQLEAQNEFKSARNSTLVDDRGRNLATLTGAENRILVRSSQISSNMKHAVIAIEDQRFYKHKGVDYKGIMRAIFQDLRRQRAAQGGSTITQQFVKNALVAQKNRSVFQKLREAALAYQLERKWSKDKILTEYLNTVYFGEGAYGIESAARVFFGWNHPGCEPDCAAVLEPAEAAMLAGHDRLALRLQPRAEPRLGAGRRNLVLERMRSRLSHEPSSPTRDGSRCRRATEIAAPRKVSKAPYFTSWVEDQLVRPLRDREHVRRRSQDPHDARPRPAEAAEQAITGRLGRRRAERGAGGDRQQHRRYPRDGGRRRLPEAAVQPRHSGAAPARARPSSRSRWSPRSRTGSRPGALSSRPQDASRARAATSRSRTTRTATAARSRWPGATTVSDNSVYAEVGYKLVGTRAVAEGARAMGVRTPISRNPAMVLGGLKPGSRPSRWPSRTRLSRERRQARIGSFPAYKDGPVGLHEGRGARHRRQERRQAQARRSGGNRRAGTCRSSSRVVTSRHRPRGIHRRVRRGQDGHHRELPGRLVRRLQRPADRRGMGRLSRGAKPMETEYRGEPVAGGTFRPRSGTTSCCRSGRSRTHAPSPRTTRARRTPPCRDPSNAAAGHAAIEWRYWQSPATAKEADQPKTPSGGGTGGGQTPAEPAPTEPTPAPTPSPDPDRRRRDRRWDWGSARR